MAMQNSLSAFLFRYIISQDHLVGHLDFYLYYVVLQCQHYDYLDHKYVPRVLALATLGLGQASLSLDPLHHLRDPHVNVLAFWQNDIAALSGR